MSNDPSGARRWSLVIRSFAGHWGLVIAAFISMLWWSWLSWPDPIVDYGREVYVPWQITQGQVLYRDIVSYFNGPLSPYLHALLFKLFGVSLRTLVWFNLLVVAALVTMLCRLIRDAAGQFAATLCGVTFCTLFGFAQLLKSGNYNYICPYSYELPHGITLTLATMICFVRCRRANRTRWLAASGFLLGLVFLTKAEIFLAASTTLATGLLAHWWITRQYRQAWREALLCAVCAAAPVAVALILLRLAMPFRLAIDGLLGAWQWIGDRQLLSLPYFKQLAGTDDLADSVKTIFVWTGGYAFVLVGLPALVSRIVKHRVHAQVVAAAVALGVGVCVSPVLSWIGVDSPLSMLNWNNFIRPAPLLLGVAVVGFAVPVLRRRASEPLRLMLVVWALAMLAKIPLNAHIYHYGFALAMPATMILIALLSGWIPAWLDRSGSAGAAMRSASASALTIAIVTHLAVMNLYLGMKTQWVGSGADAFRSDPQRGSVVARAVEEIGRLSPDGSTLAVVPEGLIINYLARRVNPTGQQQFTPPAIIMYGEDEMLCAFRENPPDYLILAGIDTAEYGARFFGQDYARKLGAWMQENYRVVEGIGPRPFRDPGFGVVIFRRIAPPR